MIKSYNSPQLDQFDKGALKLLKTSFDINLPTDNKILWFNNLLALAKENLGMAHCIQHNATARYLVESCMKDLPTFYQTDFDNLIGCYSSYKNLDTMQLNNNIVSGKKYWISNLQNADFGIMRIPTGITETYVLFDFVEHKFDVSFECDQLGLEIARPGTLTVNEYCVPPNFILGTRSFQDNNSMFVKILSFHDYCFITNYLGCIIALYTDIEAHCNRKNFELKFNLNKFKLEISNLKMLWEDNLNSVDLIQIDDRFWHRRNTQYTKSKEVLISLIGLALQIADSSWMAVQGKQNQNFRNALVFSAHMQSLYKSVTDKHFVGF